MGLSQYLRQGIVATFLLLVSYNNLTPASAKIIEAGVEHSVMLAPVPVELQPGRKFRRQPLRDETVRWAKIPTLTAGKWKLLRKFNASTLDLRTGKQTSKPSEKYDNSIAYIGYQSDSQQNIWTCAEIESKQIHSDGTYLIPSYWNLNQTSDHAFTVIKRGFSVSVDPDSHVIQDTKQLETFATFDLIAPNKLLQKYSTQWFDAAGEAIKLTEGQTEMERAGEFKPVNELNGIDVRASFKRFVRDGR